jgi:hypothetical protein
MLVGNAAAALPAPRATQRYVEQALTAGFDRPGCRLVRAPALNVGLPPQHLLSILGVLRTPPPAGAMLPPWVTFGTTDVYVRYVRRARSAFGIDWYVVVAGPSALLRPPRNSSACLTALRAAAQREELRVPARLRGGVQRTLNRFIGGERGQFAFEQRAFAPPLPVGVDLVGMPTAGGFLGGAEIIAQHPHRQDAAGPDASAIERGDAFNIIGAGLIDSSHQATILSGIVPDGVATATVYYPAIRHGRRKVAAAFTIRMHAIDNVVVASLPRPSVSPLVRRMVWRDANGAIIKAIHHRA